MKVKSHIKWVCLILMAIPVACTQSVSTGNDAETDQADVLKLEEEVKATLVKMWEAIENEDIELYASYINTEMEESIVVIRDSVAWIVYYWKDRGSTNGEAFSSSGKSTRIFVKEEGRWLCIHGHYTLLP